MSKVIIITGTSTGLGISLTVKLAQAGHRVYATMRNLNKQQGLQDALASAGVQAEIMALDVQDSTSVNACISEIIQREGRIDTLINNAGAGFIRSTEQASEEDIQWVMDVNFHGVVRTTKAVLATMRAQKQGHVINISSVGGLVGQPFSDIYCAAKFAVEGWAESLATYVTPNFGIHFTNVEPGGITTEFANNVLAQVEASGGILDDDYKPILENFLGSAATRQQTGIYQSADEVAEVVVGCLEQTEPPIRIRTSEWSEQFTRLKTQADPDGKKQQQAVIDQFFTAK